MLTALLVGGILWIVSPHVWPAHCRHESGVDAVPIAANDDILAILGLKRG